MMEYIITDGITQEKSTSWDFVIDCVGDWYHCLFEEQQWEDETPDLPYRQIYALKEGDVDALNQFITEWEDRIAMACGYVAKNNIRPGEWMGLCLAVRAERSEE